MSTTTSTPSNAEHIVIDADAQKRLFTEARTANTFSDAPVSDDQLRAIVELAQWPPTSANTNPLRVLFIRTPEAHERLAPHMSDGNRAKTLTAPVVAILAVDDDFHEQIPNLFPHKAELRDAFDSNPALREKLANLNGGLQAGYFILAIRAAGLAAGPMLGFDGPGIDQEFFAGTPWRTLLVINIGHPGENPWFDRLPRHEHDTWIQYA